MENKEDKVYISRTIRFILEQRIGKAKLFEKLREKYNVKIFSGNSEKIVLVEEKEKQE